MLLAPQPCHQNFAGVFQGVVEIDNLNGGAKAISPHVGQSHRSINEQDDLQGQRQTAADGLLSQQRTKFINGAKRGNIGGRVVVANRVTFFIPFVLREDAAQK